MSPNGYIAIGAAMVVSSLSYVFATTPDLSPGERAMTTCMFLALAGVAFMIGVYHRRLLCRSQVHEWWTGDVRWGHRLVFYHRKCRWCGTRFEYWL